MFDSECEQLEKLAEEKAKLGQNEQALDYFSRAAFCWRRWEQFSKAADAYERSYEHGMLAHSYAKAAETMLEAAGCWIRQGQHEKFEIDCQIASEAYISAAEAENNPKHYVEGAFCAIMGGDLEITKQLIHAAAETTKGQSKELINLALMLSEYQFGDADRYIEAALTRVLPREGVDKTRNWFLMIFAGFVRTSLESEVALTIKSLELSTGLEARRVRMLIRKGIEDGLIPAYLDDDSDELVVDTDRTDIQTLSGRKRPIMGSELDDPGAWDVDFDDEK